MAGLRSEALQARRLAENIENLPRDATAQQRKWKPVMTDTNIVDPGHAQRLKRRASDKPAPGGSQMSFNPLHPSMELPPEQLIRLLGMESKKIRKVRKNRKAAQSAPAAPATKVERQAKPQQEAPAAAVTPQKKSRPRRSSLQYEDSQSPMFDSDRRSLLVPALLVGVVAGISVSAYLLWSQPVPVAQQEPVAATASPAPKVQAATKPLNRKPAAKPAASTPAPAMSIQEQAQWQIDIQTETRRLRNAAEQRFAERTMQLEANAEKAESVPVTEPVLQPTAQPAMYEQPENSLETELPNEDPPAQPADSRPETAAKFLPGISFERLLGQPLTKTVDTPAATEPVPQESLTTPDQPALQENPAGDDSPALF